MKIFKIILKIKIGPLKPVLIKNGYKTKNFFQTENILSLSLQMLNFKVFSPSYTQ